jgi:predicted CoA-binding protein
VQQQPTTKELKDLLRTVRTIAVVGASDEPSRPSYSVMRFLQECGYRVIPVNPKLAGKMLLGETVYAELKEIPISVDMVDIFRNSDAAGHITDEAIFIGSKVVWMQLGVINEPAAERALRAGIRVVMNRCPHIELTK